MVSKAVVALGQISLGLLTLAGLRLAAQAPAPYTFTTIAYPASASTTPTGINTSGRIVGSYVDAGAITHGFMLDGGTYSTIDYPGARWTAAVGVNNSGQIVGGYGSNAETGRRG